MAKYLIHSCNQRQWYVDEYLIPSMLKQGIKEEDIFNYQDVNCDGNLMSYMISSKQSLVKWPDTHGVWHLQDDVIIGRDFKEQTEKDWSEYACVCAFTCFYDDGREPGEHPVKGNLWYSFPCMYIPNHIMVEYLDWVDRYVWRDCQYEQWIKKKKGDDYIFRIFMENYHPNDKCLNLAPNLIDHIDYLIGGTIVNPLRNCPNVRSYYWDDEELVDNLAKELKKRK